MVREITHQAGLGCGHLPAVKGLDGGVGDGDGRAFGGRRSLRQGYLGADESGWDCAGHKIGMVGGARFG